MIGRRWALGAGVAVAIASLPIPAALAYDPTAWLVWGRELVALELDTTGGPSWKPLPVLVTALLAPLGDLADESWLVVARAGALLGIVVAYRLAARFAGPVAGAVAAGALVLTPDGGPRFVRLVAEGHAEPLTVTLCLAAIERHLDGRRDHAILLAVGVALLRPEIWPFLGIYGLWLWSRDATIRPLLAVSLPLVPLLWLGGDWIGSGSPWHGADSARVSTGDAGRVGLAIERAWKVVVSPVWLCAAVAVAARRERALHVVGAGALAWCGLVVAMTALMGYAALSRFYLPAAGALCVLAGIGFARLLEARAAVALVMAVASLPFALPRAVHVRELAREVVERAALDRGLEDVLDRAGRDEVLGCGQVAIEPSELPAVALAEKLDLPLRDARTSLRRRPGVYVALAGGRQDRRLGEREDAVALGASARWRAYAVGCR